MGVQVPLSAGRTLEYSRVLFILRKILLILGENKKIADELNIGVGNIVVAAWQMREHVEFCFLFLACSCGSG